MPLVRVATLTEYYQAPAQGNGVYIHLSDLYA